MLDMGFSEAIEDILQQCPTPRQTLLFSATYPEKIKQLSAAFQHDAVMISVESMHKETSIQQLFFEIKDPAHKPEALVKLLAHYKPDSTLVFCNTKIACDEVTQQLKKQGIDALALHGDMEQRDRNQVLLRFSNKSCPVLVATDVAARGLDIKELAAVISYDISPDPEVHVHRIGRTGRAGEQGLAITLVASKEMNKALRIEEHFKKTMQWLEMDDIKTVDDIELPSAMVTITIDGGKKHKIRPGDLLGALTAGAGLEASAIGKIDIGDFHSYVAIERTQVNKALAGLQNGKIKGKSFKVRKVS